MNGIEKDIDNLGRIVIPVKFRKKLGVGSNEKVLISCENDSILISAVNKHCALCGKKISAEQKIRLCNTCILQIKNEC